MTGLLTTSMLLTAKILALGVTCLWENGHKFPRNMFICLFRYSHTLKTACVSITLFKTSQFVVSLGATKCDDQTKCSKNRN